MIASRYLNPERRMEGKARFVFPVVITAIIVFVVSGALTFFNIGWRNDFVMRWWSAFAIGWPIAASTAYLAIPFARSQIAGWRLRRARTQRINAICTS